MLVVSIWLLCGTTDSHVDYGTNGAVRFVPSEFLSVVIVNLFKAAIGAVVTVIVYWFCKICFVMHSGRIRRIGAEIVVALILLANLMFYANNQIWINVCVVSIALSFLYDIWRFADFQETELSIEQIKQIIEEES